MDVSNAKTFVLCTSQIDVCLFLLLFYILILSERENECEIKNRCAEDSRCLSSSEIGPLNISP